MKFDVAAAAAAASVPRAVAAEWQTVREAVRRFEATSAVFGSSDERTVAARIRLADAHAALARRWDEERTAWAQLTAWAAERDSRVWTGGLIACERDTERSASGSLSSGTWRGRVLA